MKSYGKKFVNKYIKKHTEITVETRDGILWDIDWLADPKVARVKIQGSDEYVNVHFPRNEATKPTWLKVGNAVRVVHRSGNRGFAEVIGHGQAVPTPMPGAMETPQEYTLSDGFITGGQVSASVPPSMDVEISPGTYRIDGVTYTLATGLFNEALMEDPATATMNDDYPPMIMGEGVGEYVVMTEPDSSDGVIMTMDADFPETMGADNSYTIDAAPAAGYSRYDTFAVGTDGIIDYIKGVESASDPVQPAIPAGHVQIGYYILVTGGTTEITPDVIGAVWYERTVSYMEFTDLVDEMEFDLYDDYPETNVKIVLKDQYGDAFSGSYEITLLMYGTGQIWSSQSGWNSSTVVQQFGGSSYTFKYRRDQTEDNEAAPVFQAMLTGYEEITAFDAIKLLDRDDEEIDTPPDARALYQTLTSGASIALDWSQGTRANVTLSHNAAFSFSGALDGDRLILMIRQDGTGGYTPTWPSNVEYGDEITEIIISTDANERSYVGFIYDQLTGSYDCVANVSGYPST